MCVDRPMDCQYVSVSGCLCVCAFVCIYICFCVCVCARMCMVVCVCVCVCMCVCVCVHALYVCMHTMHVEMRTVMWSMLHPSMFVQARQVAQVEGEDNHHPGLPLLYLVHKNMAASAVTRGDLVDAMKSYLEVRVCRVYKLGGGDWSCFWLTL